MGAEQDQPSLSVGVGRTRCRVRPGGDGQVWLADITYVPTKEFYLAVVLDLFSGKIVTTLTAYIIAAKQAAVFLQRVAMRRNAL